MLVALTEILLYVALYTIWALWQSVTQGSEDCDDGCVKNLRVFTALRKRLGKCESERGALAPRWMSNTLRTPTGG